MTTLRIALQPPFDGPRAGRDTWRRHLRSRTAESGPTLGDVKRLADRILSLDEPWRSRFVCLVAEQVEDQVPADEALWRSTLMRWLAHGQIYRFIGMMVCTWTHQSFQL